MPIYHIVLLKLRPGTTPTQITNFVTSAKGMVGQIPGLLKLEANAPLASTASRGKGFNMGLVAVLEKADDVGVYAEHPAHLAIQDARVEIAEDALAYDLEYAE